MEAAGQYFVAPDNGVLAMIFAREKHKVRVISKERYFRHPVSQTFHGRDIFAPVAAHVAAGVTPSRIGKLISDYVNPKFTKPRRTGPDTWTGRILAIDRFGNIVTNFHAIEYPAFSKLTIGRATIRRLVESYAEAPTAKLVAIVGSSGYLEVSLKEDSAAKRIGCSVGDACLISP
jgi:S-adenosylmethionine hydrolase